MEGDETQTYLLQTGKINMIMKKNILLSCLILAGYLTEAQEISASRIKTDISFLASDKLKGRGTSSNEELIAANYIAKEFQKLKLSPKGNQTANNKKTEQHYFYNFTFKLNTNPHDTSTANIHERTGINVVGFLDNAAANTIVIGAHYDHLGLGHDHNSLDANPDGKIHNGADDNASGTAGVLELARYFKNNGIKENYNFLFMCYSGEELGLLGSKKWCDNPSVPLSSINYMFNMDMIGRLNDTTKKLMIYGFGTSPTWGEIVDKQNNYFTIKKDSAGIGPSDQTSFYLKDIPVLHFFTGQHSDYHKPSDDVHKINFTGEQKVLEYIVALINATNNLPKLTFSKTAAPASNKTSFKVTLGVMPDYAFEGKGMRIDGVTDGKPAAKAGLIKGDVIIQMGELTVDNVYDYMKGLSTYKKGDSAKVKVQREQKELEFTVTF